MERGFLLSDGMLFSLAGVLRGKLRHEACLKARPVPKMGFVSFFYVEKMNTSSSIINPVTQKGCKWRILLFFFFFLYCSVFIFVCLFASFFFFFFITHLSFHFFFHAQPIKPYI